MQQKTKMVVQLGDHELVIGEATPAQVRILTKKDVGKLVDGKLHLNLRPVHFDVGERNKNTYHLGGVEDPRISKAEINRRWLWFKDIMKDVVRQDLIQVPERDPRDRLEAILKANPFRPGSKFPFAGPEWQDRPDPNVSPEEMREWLAEAGAKIEGEVVVDDDGNLIVELVDEPFELTPYDVEMIDFFRDKVEEIWSSAPDVSRYFGVPTDAVYSGSVLKEDELEAFIEQYEKEVAEDPESKVIAVKFTQTTRVPQITG